MKLFKPLTWCEERKSYQGVWTYLFTVRNSPSSLLVALSHRCGTAAHSLSDAMSGKAMRFRGTEVLHDLPHDYLEVYLNGVVIY